MNLIWSVVRAVQMSLSRLMIDITYNTFGYSHW